MYRNKKKDTYIMGMAASQVRFLQLTHRKADITMDLEHYSMQKTSLTRDMKKVTQKYKDAISAKRYMLSSNNGANYYEFSYTNLSKPSLFNNNEPYLLTNNNGQVVLDTNFAKYAKMISQNGTSGGDYANNRIAILSDLLRIDPAKFEHYDNTIGAINYCAESVIMAKEALADLECLEPIRFYTNSAMCDFFGSYTGIVNDKKNTTVTLANAYAGAQSISLGKIVSTNAMYGDTIKAASEQIGKTFLSVGAGILQNFGAQVGTNNDLYNAMSDAINSVNQGCQSMLQTTKADLTESWKESHSIASGNNIVYYSNVEDGAIKGDVLKLDIINYVDAIMGAYLADDRVMSTVNSATGQKVAGIPNSINAYDSWCEAMNNAKFVLKKCEEMYNCCMNGSIDDNGNALPFTDLSSPIDINFYSTASNSNIYACETYPRDLAAAGFDTGVYSLNQIFSAEEEKQIEFYDKLFSAVVEKGWQCDYQVNDNDYLAQVMKNGIYYFTQIEKQGTDDEGNYIYGYKTSLAENSDNVYSVTDSAITAEALAEYEYEKSVISAKEERVDVQMNNLQTEQSSIEAMLKSVESVENENIKKNFNLFS